MVRRIANEQGLTLAELLAAVAIVSIGLVAVATGFQYAASGLETGKQQTTATFLAEQRLEQIKASALTNFDAVTTATFGSEAYGTIANAANYRRTVSIVDDPGNPPMTGAKLVQVSVFYRPVAAFGVLGQERQVSVASVLTRR